MAYASTANAVMNKQTFSIPDSRSEEQSVEQCSRQASVDLEDRRVFGKYEPFDLKGFTSRNAVYTLFS